MERAQPQDFGRVLSSMCTEPHPVAREAAERFLTTNPGDPGTYATVSELEARAVARLGEIVGLEYPEGYIASGGTEANIQAVRIARNRADTDTPNIVAPKSAHFSLRKAAGLLQVELRTAPLDGYRADTDAMAELIDEDTVAAIAIAGTTEYGRVDPIPAIADLAADAGTLCHVDAAWGGFILPFTDHEWSFEDAPIDTMTIDPHKMGQAAIPAGGLVCREGLVEELTIDTPYLESASQITLTGTRSGAGIASALAVMEELWPDGYRDGYEAAARNAEWFTHALRDRDIDVVEPDLPLVAADVTERTFEGLRDAGWRVSRTAGGELRVVCMPHVTRPMLHSVVADIDRVRVGRGRISARAGGNASPAGVPREHLD